MKLELLDGNGTAHSYPRTANEKSCKLSGIAVAGLGYWGPNWVRNLYQSQCASRLICCDLDAARLQHMKTLYPSVEVNENLDAVLADPDVTAVIVATPVTSHYEIARRCLEADKAVLVEKPLATSTAQAAQLIRLARERNLTLMVGHTFEYSTPVLKVREIINSGELGDNHYLGSVRANLGIFQRDINVAWDLATHDLSIILMLLEKMPSMVSCQGQSHYQR